MNTLQICNAALSMLGIGAITSLDDENTQARQCKLFFPMLRDRLLREHTWSFAQKQHQLQQLNEEALDGEYAYVCALPVNFIMMVRTQDDEQYEIMGRRILIDRLCVITYIARIEDSEQFDVSFCEALQYSLAAEIAMSNTSDMSIVTAYKQEAMRAISTARSIDSIENEGGYQHKRTGSFLAAKIRGI